MKSKADIVKTLIGPPEDDGQGPWQSDWSWRDIPAGILGATSGAGNALYNIGASLAPFEFNDASQSAGGQAGFSARVPPAITGAIDAFQGLKEASPVGYVPDIRNPEVQNDARNALMTIYGGNALNPLRGRAVTSSMGALAHDLRPPLVDTVSTGMQHSGPWEPGQQMRAYHGTSSMQDFDKFNRPPWMSDVPDVANSAAYPDIPPDIEWTRNQGPARVFPLDIAPKNPYVIDYNAAGDPLKAAAERHGYEWTGLEDPQSLAARNGHDFVMYENTGEDFGVRKPHRQIVPLQPNTVRSATTGEILFSDTGRPSLLGSALASSDQSQGITAYHGSPHDFDKFSLDYVGTGEGNQARGYGMYFASAEPVGKYYKEALAPGGGHMYQVRINAPEERFMDTDKPLSAQSQFIQNALMSDRVRDVIRAQHSIQDLGGRYLVKGPSGSASTTNLAEAQKWLEDDLANADIRRSYADDNAPYLIANNYGDPKAMTEALRDSGVAGTKYLDEHSRLAQDGLKSHNYVVFDDSLIEILKKYGLVGGTLGAGNALSNSDFNSAAYPTGY